MESNKQERINYMVKQEQKRLEDLLHQIKEGCISRWGIEKQLAEVIHMMDNIQDINNDKL